MQCMVQRGFLAIYQAMFGDPWEAADHVEPIFPADLVQPSPRASLRIRARIGA